MSTLTLIFIVLKLVGVISWSWFWVISPTILDVATLLLMTVISSTVIFKKH